MADRMDSLTEDVQDIKGKLNHLSERFDHLSASVDERFDAVDVAIREQREYTEFAYGRMDKRFDQIQLSFGRLEAKVDERFGRFESWDIGSSRACGLRHALTPTIMFFSNVRRPPKRATWSPATGGTFLTAGRRLG